jgi:hypothetical protein
MRGTLRAFILLLFAASLAASSNVAAQDAATENAATRDPAAIYNEFKAWPEPLKYLSPEDSQRLDALRASPQALTDLIVADLSLPGQDEDVTRNIQFLLRSYLPVDDQMEVARRIATSGAEPPLDLLRLLAEQGVGADLEIVENAIRRSPDSLGVPLALTLGARADVPIQRLEELAAERPGPWADAIDLQLRRPIGTLRRALELRRNQGGQQLPEPPIQQ